MALHESMRLNLLGKVGRYWHTLRHLRPVQLYGRIWFRFYSPQPDLRPPPDLRMRPGIWQFPARRNSSMTGPRSFVFLNEAGELDNIGWDGPQREKLWRYNQHYFDDLNAIDTEARHAWHAALIKDWISHNPAGQGNGWEPYPLSLRVVNWIKWALSGGALSSAAQHSLAVQARWLTKHLEIHLLGNHLFANAKALLFAGLFFDGIEADNWCRSALEILLREIPEQILSDGGQFELSTMYHALALEDVLDLINVISCYEGIKNDGDYAAVRSSLMLRAAGMMRWLQIMCHPDGEIAFFNDAAFGIAPKPAELAAYFTRCFPTEILSALRSIEVLPDSGYMRLTLDTAVVLLDVARIGPDYLPGHAHADTLSFELSLFGQRFLVNGGTSCYGTSAERLRQRGTAAHNTVVVNGQNSSEVWSGFRVARRAYPCNLNWEEEVDCLEVQCGHDGYRWLKGSPQHSRRWFLHSDYLLIEDQIQEIYQEALAIYRFHPAVKVTSSGTNGCEGMAVLPQGQCVRWIIERGRGKLVKSSWHPQFGISQSCFLLQIRIEGGYARIRFIW